MADIKRAVLIYTMLVSAILASAKPLLSNSTTYQSSTAPSPEWRCFPTRTPFPLDVVNMADCRQLVRDIANLDRSGKKWVYGTPDAPGVERTVPATFSRRTCITHIIDMESTEAAYDAFTMRYLSQKLSRMAEMCVEPAPHLGGEGKIGAKEVLAIVVVGVAEPDTIRLPEGISNVTRERSWDDFVVSQRGISETFPTEVQES